MGIIKYFEKKISSFEDSMKKALGFDPTDYASKYTTNYDYSLHIPPPCTYYSTVNAGQCCTTKQYNENKSECKLCTPEAEKANKCVYNMDKPETTKEWNDTNVHDWFANVIKNGDSIDTYLDIIGKGNHALPLGSRFYAKNGLKCIGRNGEEVDAYNYYNNYKNKPLSDSMIEDLFQFSISDIYDAVNDSNSTSLNKHHCNYKRRQVGLKLEDNSCSDSNKFTKNIKCIYQDFPTLPPEVNGSHIDTEHFENGNEILKDVTDTKNKICNCNFKLYGFFLVIFLILLLLNFLVFN